MTEDPIDLFDGAELVRADEREDGGGIFFVWKGGDTIQMFTMGSFLNKCDFSPFDELEIIHAGPDPIDADMAEDRIDEYREHQPFIDQ